MTDFRAWGKLLNRIFSWTMLTMTVISMGIILTRGFDATYFMGSHPTVPTFGYRVRTVALYFALGYLASSRFNSFKGIPVAFSCILIPHALFEAFQHVSLFSFIIGRIGFSIWMKDMALYTFMLSTSVYVLNEIDVKKLSQVRHVKISLCCGVLIWTVSMAALLWWWWPTIVGIRPPLIFQENIPLEVLPSHEAIRLSYERFVHFGVKFGLFQMLTALTMAFRREPT